MANEVYNFPFFTISTDYPESSTRVQFGNSWVFTAKPNAPDQRIFTLHYPVMWYYVDQNNAINYSKNTTRNFAVLEQFYQAHRLWKEFDFPHPIYGTLVCRFHEPLRVPEGIKGGDGALQSFEVKLIEVP